MEESYHKVTLITYYVFTEWPSVFANSKQVANTYLKLIYKKENLATP